MRFRNTLIVSLITFFFITAASATVLNGRVNIINNDGNNFKIMLQINTDTQSQKMGGATIVIDYDSTLLSFPDNPEIGTDYIFSNFNMGFYDTAKVTKATSGQIWINIDLILDGHGTIVQKGPDSWTDMVMLNFVSSHIISSSVIYWSINNKYWGVYDSDNATIWDKGNFGSVTYAGGNGDGAHNGLSYNLNQNYPNPFNPSTKISYSVPEESYVTLKVYDVLGNEVATLVNEKKSRGYYNIEFNAISLASGIYFSRIQAVPIGKQEGNFVAVKKMILLK